MLRAAHLTQPSIENKCSRNSFHTEEEILGARIFSFTLALNCFCSFGGSCPYHTVVPGAASHTDLTV